MLSFKTSMESRQSQSRKAGSGPDPTVWPRGAIGAPWLSYYEQDTYKKKRKGHLKRFTANR